MAESLIFIPDISGFTKFIQNTEVEHSQHVIAELLELLIAANTSQLHLAEVEGDALFFYKENDLPSQDSLLLQVESMFTAFYSHLELLKKNRICPCHACATAPELELKIIAHSGELQFIEVQGNRKPFGQQVIEAHRLLKNSVQSDNYALVSLHLAEKLKWTEEHGNGLFNFEKGNDAYDGKTVEYLYSIIDSRQLEINLPATDHRSFSEIPDIVLKETFTIGPEGLLETITNYSIREQWTPGADRYEFNHNEVTRSGTQHVCVINGSDIDFRSFTLDAEDGELTYGETTSSPPPVDEFIQTFHIRSLDRNRSLLETRVYLKAKSPFKRIVLFLFFRSFLKKNLIKSLNLLKEYVNTNLANPVNSE